MALNNNVRLEGYCAAKPEINIAKSGVGITSINVYTINMKSAGESGNSQRHRCVFIGKRADRACNLIEKGSHISLNGILRYKEFFDREGNKRRVAEILVEDFMLSPKEKAPVTLKRTIREILKEENITEEEQLGILND
jgi:single-strand DNA-binding protein